MLKELRQERSLTQTQLASKLGVADSTIRSWENQNREPNFEILCKIAKILEITVGQLLGVEEY